MKWIKGLFTLIALILIAAVFHYNLPSTDVVQITGTEVKRMDIGKRGWFWAKPDAGTKAEHTRDVRFINSDWPNGKPRVYRNEDTDWSFPWYFKFDSGNLTAQAQSLGNRHGTDDVWVAVKHYGWRIPILSMYPNAISIKQVEGPNTFIIPWFNIIFFIILFVILFWIWRIWRRFKKKRIEPVTDKIGDVAGDIGDELKEKREESRSFFRRWFGSSK